MIPILSANEEDIARLTLRRTTLKENGLCHSLKKAAGSKKRKKADPTETVVPSAGLGQTETASSDTTTKAVKEPQAVKSSHGIKNTSTASLTAKVLEEQDDRNKRRKMAQNDNLKSLFSQKNHDPNSKERDISFMNRGYAIPGRK